MLSAAQGDKDALKALQIQSDFEVKTHQGFAGANTDGLSAGQTRALKADSVWSNLNRRAAALTNQYARTAAYDPDGAKVLSDQIDDLNNQIEARKGQVLKQGGKGKTLDAATAATYLQKAGGDKVKARQLAAADGWSF